MNETGNSGRSVTVILPDQVVADAMAAKRRDLIAQPLERIWPDLARAAIAAMPGWQPIATAPKDGTPVLIAERSDLTNGDHHWYIDTAVNCFELDIREVDVWKARESDETVCFAPTHWMPLPPPPEAQP